MISVIMPAYNAEKFIGEAIQSILDQTFQQFELIIVDDGSSDNTVNIIKSYCEKDSRITLIQNEHGGACKARNDAIRAAQYEWIAAMDADDIALPNRLERLMQAAKEEPDIIVWGSHQYQVNLNGKIIGKVQVGPKSKEEFYNLDRTKHVISVVNPTAMFKKDIALQVGGYNERLTAAQEIELWDRMAEFGPIRIVPEFLMKYRLHDGSISAKRFHEQCMFHAYVLERYKARVKGEELSIDDFIEDYKTRPLPERFFRYMHNSGRSYYRNTGVLLSNKKYFRASMSLILSFLLSPKFSYNRTKNRLIAS